MNYEEAARKLIELAAQVDDDEALAAKALETAGAVHTEALLASLEAFIQAARIVKVREQEGAAQQTTQSGAILQPMPDKTAEIEIGFPLSSQQWEVLRSGQAPEDDFERWYLAVDGMHLRYYRNATGYCFFDATVEPAGDGYIVSTATVNQDDKQYTEDNLEVCVLQVKILLANNLGLDDEEYWDQMDELS